MEESERKFFCCPECGARYKVVLDGKKYQCKKCGEPFQITDLTNPTPINKPAKQTSVDNKTKKWAVVLISLFLIISFFVCINSINKTSKPIVPSSSETAIPPPPVQLYEPELETTVSPKPNPLYEPKLELLSWRWSDSGSFLRVEGEVKNISSESLDNVEVLASFYESNNIFVKSAEALIEYNPILPGQTSPFKAITSSNPAIKTSSIQFKKVLGGTIRYRQAGK